MLKMSKNLLRNIYITSLFLLYLPMHLVGTPNPSIPSAVSTNVSGQLINTNFEAITTEPVRQPLGQTKGRYLSVEDGKGLHCRKRAKCEKLNNNSCFGVKLPYSSTTLDLVDDVTSQEQVLEKLSALSEGLRQIPKCWAIIQPLLCSLYMPRCEDEMVDLPSQEMCNMTIWPCRTLLQTNNWPSFPKCENTTVFPPKCRNDVRELKFNTTGQCQTPLVQTDNSFAFYEGIEGCGIQCQNPLFTNHEQQQLYNVIAYGGSICLAMNLFTAITFLIDWRSANKYPPLIIFYINCCFAVSCIGWLAQFMPNARQDIVCRKDGTLRMAEPSAVENLSCVIIFVLVYYPIIAALVWFVILTYAWHISFQSVGKLNDSIDKKGVYFHMASWSIPLILTITTMALGEIDGSSVAGICFVGYINHAYRVGFLWGPILIAVLISGYFIFKVLYTLIMLKISSQDIVSELATSKIQKTIVRIAVFSLFMLVLGITSFICHVYEFLNHRQWKDSFRKLIICKVTASSGLSSTHMDPRQCRLDARPSVSVFQLHLLVFFCAGIVMSSWVWTGSTLRTWRRFLRRNICSQKEEPVRMKKHKAIAQAFANWKTFNNDGRLSISFHSSHEDPVGLNLDVNSIASLDFSSTWAAALPTLMTRRGALIGGSATSTNTSASSHHGNSLTQN
ncbi:Protein smoothened [Gryllus bimaculatus]|nr:Protein smoothened [Gryllus bimaculatus]